MVERILWTENIKQYFGGIRAVDDVSIEVNKFEIVGIIGPNGAGKTTFFNNITGMTKPTAGKIYFKGKNITGFQPHRVTRLGIARTFQNIRLFKHMTALENVQVGLHPKTEANVIDCIFRLPRHKKKARYAFCRCKNCPFRKDKSFQLLNPRILLSIPPDCFSLAIANMTSRQ